MRTGTVSYRLEDLKKKVIIPIGFVGENDFTRVIFDAEEVYKNYPDAQVSMKVQPPKGSIYPATVTRDGNAVIWQVKAADVANRGGGELQLTFTEGETVIKTYIARTDVKRSLAGNGTAPDPVQDWIDDAEEVLDDLEAAEVHQPIIGLDGYWYRWNQEAGEYVTTGTKAQGQDGHSPVLTSSKSGKTTTIYSDGTQLAQIQDGEDGQGADVIDDTAGEGDNDKTWSADKLTDEFGDVLSGIAGQPDLAESSKTGVDLDVSDEQGNVLVRFKNGNIQTKEFNSAEAPETKDSTKLNVDFDLSDPNGNVLLRLKNGHIETKNFNSKKIADVKSFGAVGDGTTDDTEALETAMAYGFANNVPVRFSSGTYIVRRPLTLRSNMEIFGEGNPVIKSKASFTTTLSSACAENDETITVTDASGFSVGDMISISNDSSGDAAARHCSVGTITEIDGNDITFVSAYDSIKKGAIKAHESGSYVSNACAIFRSWGMYYDCDNVYIHNLTLNGNRQNGEWADWHMGCIHIDAGTGTKNGITYNKSQKNPTFRDLTIVNAHFDGISDQGDGGGTVENCKIDNPLWHGIHFGTDYSYANVLNNTIKNTQQGAGVFWCASAENIIVEGNRILSCNKGCSDYEYGNAGNRSVINGNIFKGIVSYVFDFSLGTESDQGTIIISDNIIETPGASIARLKNRKKVIFTSNIIESLANALSVVFDCTGSSALTFIGNIAPDTQATIISGNPTDVINSLNAWN